jgi:hypothetical protein
MIIDAKARTGLLPEFAVYQIRVHQGFFAPWIRNLAASRGFLRFRIHVMLS